VGVRLMRIIIVAKALISINKEKKYFKNNH
jgi:hypothetical protein